MAQLQVNPQHAERLRQLGLQRPEDFLALRGVIVSGHPDRHVQAVELAGYGRVFLKKEHRIQLTHRWESWWRGYGAVSLCCREFTSLCRLADAGIPCPEPLAAGELQGQAFLLLREVEGAVELRRFLQQHSGETTRRLVAAALGEQLARVHTAGFDHPDLYSKHVLVQFPPRANRSTCANPGFTFLDWQRSQRRTRVSLRRRCRDLAALDATLAEELASPRDRLRCLAAYLRTTTTLSPQGPLPELRSIAIALRQRSLRLQRLRRVREQRLPPLPEGSQELLWLEGEALCVTRRFYEQLTSSKPTPCAVANGTRSVPATVGERHPESACYLPPWLLAASQFSATAPDFVEKEMTLPNGSRGHLLVRQQRTGSARWWGKGRPNTPELATAAALFRLQRQGVVVPTLLAFGQRQTTAGLVSFLLVEASTAGIPLVNWLATHPRSPQRRAVLRQLGEILRRTQQANYEVGEEDFLVLAQPECCTVALGTIATLNERKDWRLPTALAAVSLRFPDCFRLCSYWERQYCLLHYLNLRRLPDRMRHQALAVQQRAAQTRVRSHA